MRLAEHDWEFGSYASPPSYGSDSYFQAEFTERCDIAQEYADRLYAEERELTHIGCDSCGEDVSRDIVKTIDGGTHLCLVCDLWHEVEDEYAPHGYTAVAS